MLLGHAFSNRELQDLEELIQDQLDAQHIKESTSPWYSLVLLLKRNLENREL